MYQQDLTIFLSCFNKTIIPIAVAGYEMIIVIFGYQTSHPRCGRGIVVLKSIAVKKYFITDFIKSLESYLVWHNIQYHISKINTYKPFM